MSDQVAQYLGIDVGTGGVELGVRSATGVEGHASVDISDETIWRGVDAFNVQKLPERLIAGLQQLELDGWAFQPTGDSALSFSVRQHDMCLLCEDGTLLMDGIVLGWRCAAAEEEVNELTSQGVADVVGKIEARFILPKLQWLLKQQPELQNEVRYVMTTGDYIAWMLTGKRRLSTSDALSNGLLNQSDKSLAVKVLRQAGFNVDWFPTPISSGEVVGQVAVNAGLDPRWEEIRERLFGWNVTAGLGDNHAAAVGCGLNDESTIVISAGNSGTINRAVAVNVPLREPAQAAQFEYYDKRLLLMMLADCTKWYDRFRKQFAAGAGHAELNEAALESDVSNLSRVRQEANGGGFCEVYPAGFDQLTLGEQAASTQYSIALELMLLAKSILAETPEHADVAGNFMLTGGLSQSLFFQHCFSVGLRGLIDGASVAVSARSGALAYENGAYGALVNAMLPGDFSGEIAKAAVLCPSEEVADTNEKLSTGLGQLLKQHLWD